MEELFNLVKNYGYIVRSNELDGLQSWNKIKSTLQSICCKELEWSMNLKTLASEPHASEPLNINGAYNYIYIKLKMKGEDNEEEKCNPNWEKYHFFLQLARIPKNNPKCDLVRLCQIAYNLGQLSAVYNDAIYTENVKRFYEINNLGDIITYTRTRCSIDEHIIESIRQLIESKKIGSGYLHKYKKYKNKYLQKKK
jgi:hypothetical protein